MGQLLKMEQTNFRPRAAGRPSRSENAKQDRRVVGVREALISNGKQVERAQKASAAAALGLLGDGPFDGKKGKQQHNCSICGVMGHKRGTCRLNPERRDPDRNKKAKLKA